MPWLTTVLSIGGIGGVLLMLYGLHRLGLWLEERGLIYYWRKKSETGAARAWMPLQELVEPQVRHAVEAEDQGAIQSVGMSEGNMGCPHEEGEDYPMGEDSPFCPFWRGKQGSSRQE